jgi:hypothetical protein
MRVVKTHDNHICWSYSALRAVFGSRPNDAGEALAKSTDFSKLPGTLGTGPPRGCVPHPVTLRVFDV